ncbi:MAG: tRNA pseudouridine(13) synthase TruD [Proteobacteria bacterium]|nr:tRNA pseudouridine(13) synthase TruD [Pseudomonadota bacterium]
MENEWPYAAAEILAIPGTIKERYEDFQVDEIPAYEPSGSGDHIYFFIEKRGLSTGRAVRDIARALGVRTGNIGVAGMKDARGVTRQMLSLEHVDPIRIRDLNIPEITILNVDRHRNKLRTGHLKGNRFAIKLRHTSPDRIDDVRDIFELLSKRGVPNYFGPQRFGNRGDTWQIGKALLLGDFEAAADIIAGRPGPDDKGDVLRARELFAAGHYTESAHSWPRGFSECAILCREMERLGGDCRRAVLSLDRRALRLYVSACQSRMFNTVLASRIERFDQIEEGDVAWKHDSGAVFLVENLSAEKPRAERFEISASGPMFGPKMKLPKGQPLLLEQRVLEQENLTLENFSNKGPLSCPGGRRTLRFRPEDAFAESSSDEHGAYIEIRFVLPSGCYATSVLREICKDLLVQTASRINRS